MLIAPDAQFFEAVQANQFKPTISNVYKKFAFCYGIRKNMIHLPLNTRSFEWVLGLKAFEF